MADKLSKPIPISRTPIYNYHECAKYVAQELGIENLRDVLGKFGKDDVKKVEYQDFWHVVVEACDPHNGCEINLSKEAESYIPAWAVPIWRAFIEHFGFVDDDEEDESATFWVEW